MFRVNITKKNVIGFLVTMCAIISLGMPGKVNAAEVDEFHGAGTYDIGNESGKHYSAWKEYDGNVQATVTDNGSGYSLSITGSGRMADWDDDCFLPWEDVADQISDVYIQEGITNIGSHLLSTSAISSIDIPGSVTEIGEGAFYRCDSLTNLIIPDSVEAIGPRICFQCDNLASVTIGDRVQRICEESFMYDHNLKDVKLPDNLEVIERYAFYDCHALDNVDFPGSLTEICTSAFTSTDITEVTIPDSVTKIEAWAFKDCPVESVCGFRNVVPDDAFVGLFRINKEDTGMTRLYSNEPMPINIEKTAYETAFKDYDWGFDNRTPSVIDDVMPSTGSPEGSAAEVEDNITGVINNPGQDGLTGDTETSPEPVDVIDQIPETVQDTNDVTIDTPVNDYQDPVLVEEPDQNKKVFRSVVGALAVGTIGLAVAHATGALHYLWLLVLALIYGKKRIRFHGMLTEDVNRFVQVKDMAFDIIYTVQDIIDGSDDFDDCVAKIYERKEYTLIPYMSKMSISYQGDNDVCTGEYDADEDTLYKELEKIRGAGDVTVHIYNIRFGFDIVLNFKM